MVYQEAAGILEKARAKKGSVKSLVMSSKYKNKKRLYAIVCETLKYSKVIDQIMESSQLLRREKLLKTHQGLASVLVYDFLFGKGIQSKGKWTQMIMKNKNALQAALSRLKVSKKVVKNEDLLSAEIKGLVKLPRYVRVNTLKTTSEDVIKHFEQKNYKCVLTPKAVETRLTNTDDTSAKCVELIKSLGKKQFMADLHIPQVLVFPPGTDLHDHPLYISGDIILQDKSSCIPAYVLNPPLHSHVIDACAAPGNKTSHLAAILNNTGKIFAFDLDAQRLSVMSSLLLRSGVTNTQTRHGSFLDLDPRHPQYSQVRHILLDPSCSGSGMAGRMDALLADGPGHGNDPAGDPAAGRLRSLAEFQLAALRQALSFPAVQRVVYSTCSVHREENEEVVEKALQAVQGQFRLSQILPGWKHRGSGHADLGQVGLSACLRASPQQDLTNGFFVALFERCDGDSTGTPTPTPTSTSDQAGSPSIQRKKKKNKKKKKKVV